jgi:hypothetical protein
MNLSKVVRFLNDLKERNYHCRSHFIVDRTRQNGCTNWSENESSELFTTTTTTTTTTNTTIIIITTITTTMEVPEYWNILRIDSIQFGQNGLLCRS